MTRVNGCERARHTLQRPRGALTRARRPHRGPAPPPPRLSVHRRSASPAGRTRTGRRGAAGGVWGGGSTLPPAARVVAAPDGDRRRAYVRWSVAAGRFFHLAAGPLGCHLFGGTSTWARWVAGVAVCLFPSTTRACRACAAPPLPPRATRATAKRRRLLARRDGPQEDPDCPHCGRAKPAGK